MFAVSEQWGCTGSKKTVGEVISEARSLIGYIEWYATKVQELEDAP